MPTVQVMVSVKTCEWGRGACNEGIVVFLADVRGLENELRKVKTVSAVGLSAGVRDQLPVCRFVAGIDCPLRMLILLLDLS